MIHPAITTLSLLAKASGILFFNANIEGSIPSAPTIAFNIRSTFCLASSRSPSKPDKISIFSFFKEVATSFSKLESIIQIFFGLNFLAC